MTAYLPSSSLNSSLLPADFVPQCRMHCSRCGTHFVMCFCENMDYGEDMVFLMDPIPPYFSVSQRIERWALLASYHPSLGRFNTTQFVQQLHPAFLDDLVVLKPIVTRQMEEYKHEGLRVYSNAISGREEELHQRFAEDCDFAVEHFFKGNWGYLTRFQLGFLVDMISTKEPQDFDPMTAQRYQRLVDALDLIVVIYDESNLRRLEVLGNGTSYT